MLRRDDRPADDLIEHTRAGGDQDADWVIYLGAEGGDKGGDIVAEGTPEDVAEVGRSYRRRI